MTPTQRRELERLIDEARYAMLELGLAQGTEAEAREASRVAETYRAITRYLDEVTASREAVSVSGDELAQEIRRRNAAEALAYWDGFDAALTAVEEGQPLYGTTKKAVAALRVAAEIGRGITEQDRATSAEAVSGA